MTKQEFLAMSLGKGLVLQSPYGFRPNRKESTGILGFAYLTGDLYADIENETFPAEFIPICRPLSDLTKPIEHKGEKFIPIERLLEDITNAWRLCKLDYPNDSKGLYNDIISNIEACEFWLIQNLVEWHFDLFGGIENKEAINANNLKINPYK